MPINTSKRNCKITEKNAATILIGMRRAVNDLMIKDLTNVLRKVR